MPVLRRLSFLLVRLVVIVFSILISCPNLFAVEVKIKKRLVLEGIPSASGVEFYDDHIYITADNSPWLFKLDKHYKLTGKFSIYDLQGLAGDTIPKAIKPDFEAMTIVADQGNTFFYIFGSGSKSPYRNVLVKTHVDSCMHSAAYDVTLFYDRLKEAGSYSNDNFNIEAVAAVWPMLVFANRATNDLLCVDITRFNAFLSDPETELAIRVFHFTLPSIGAIESRLSGCTAIPGTNKILFTASVENTADWIADGEVLGSFIGITTFSDMENRLQPVCFQIEKDAGVQLKIESIAVTKASGNKAELLMVSDNDEGQSELIEAILQW